MRPHENSLTPSNQALQPTGGCSVISWAPPAAERRALDGPEPGSSDIAETNMDGRIPGFKGEYLWELELPSKHVMALAEAFPADKYGCRAGTHVRSVSEVFVALGNFLLLDMAGVVFITPAAVNDSVYRAGLEPDAV